MGGAYYNELDPYVAQWLRNLIAARLIPEGEVDERSIVDVRPDDLRGFTQCHFFAGIGGWAYALRLAGWPDDRPVWTGSCPCQPFSVAGRRKGFDDERHLWPTWFDLIRECAPPVVFGEQVASTDGLTWLDLVQADLEGSGYASAAFDLCAAGIGAPHIRHRLWFVGDAGFGAGRSGGGLADAGTTGLSPRELAIIPGAEQFDEGRTTQQRSSSHGGLADAHEGQRRRVADGEGREPYRQAPGRIESDGEPQSSGADAGGLADAARPGPTNGLWRDADWLLCRDGKWRPVEPGTFPLAHGVSGRVGRLRAYGNAIVPQVAAEFIRAYFEVRADA